MLAFLDTFFSGLFCLPKRLTTEQLENGFELSKLPEEIQKSIFSFCDSSTINHLSQTSIQIKKIADCDFVWKNICLRVFPITNKSDEVSWKIQSFNERIYLLPFRGDYQMKFHLRQNNLHSKCPNFKNIQFLAASIEPSSDIKIKQIKEMLIKDYKLPFQESQMVIFHDYKKCDDKFLLKPFLKSDKFILFINDLSLKAPN